MGNYDNLVVHGDSISYGSAASNYAELGYIGLTAWEKNKNLYNYAVSGSTIGSFASNVPKSNSFNNNGWVIVNYGTNDNTAISTWSADYKKLIQQVIDYGYSKSKIIICSPPYQTNKDIAPVKALVQQIATDMGIVFCDLYTYTLNNGGSSLLDDGTHPNTSGHRVVANYLKTYIT